ncbi:MAG: hypothetical protein FWC11_04815, partial [Firmicutes bacterium]|nr:hypothetical protein [Bacillota bacterium]
MKTKSSFIKNNKRRIALLCLVALFAVMSVLTMGNFNVGIPSIAADNRLIFVQVEAGEDFAIGLTIDGEIYGWSLIRGSNSDFGWQDNRHIFTSDDEGVHVYEMSQRTLGQFYPGIPTRIPVTFRGMRSIDNSPWHLQGIGGNEIEDRIVQIATTRTAAAFITQRGFIYTWGSDPATMGIELEVAGGTQTTRPWQNGILHRNIMSSTVTGPNPYGSRQYYIPKQNPSFFTPDLIDTLSFRYFDSSGGPVGLGHGAGIGHGLAIEFDNNTDANGIGTNSRRAIGIWGGVDNFVVERADSQFVAWGNMTYMQIPVEGIGYPTPIVGHLDSPGVGGRVVAGAGFVAHIAEVGVDNLSIRGRNYHVPFFGAAGIPLGAGAAFLSRDNSVRGGVPHDPGRTLYGEFANGFFPLINTSLGQDVLLNLDGQLVENLWVEWNNQGYGYLDYGNFNRPSNAVALRNALIPTFQTAPGVSVRATASNPSVPFFGTAGGDFNVARNRMSNNMTNVALGNGIVYFIDSSNNVRFFGTDYNNSHNVSTGHANASGATFTGLPAGDWRQVVAGQVPMGANTALIRDDNAIVGYDTLFRRGADLLLGGNPVGMDISWGHSISKVETLVGATSLNLLPVDGNPFHWYDFAGHGIQNSHISAALLDEVQNIGGANRQVWAWNRDGNSTGNIVADTGGWVHFHNFRLSENHQIATISSGYGNNLFAISSQGVMFRIQWEANFTYGGQTGLFVARAMTEFQDENGDTLEGWSTRGLANALSVDFRVNMNCVGCRPRAAGQPLVACDENCNRTAAQHSTDNPVRVNVGYQTPTGGVSPHDLTRLNVYGTLPIAQRAGLADDRFSIYEDSRLGHAYRLLLTDPRSDTIVPHLVPGATQIPPVTRGDFAENVETFVPVGHFGMFRKGENPNLVGDYMTANPTLPLNRSWSMNPFDNQFFGIEIDNFVSGSRNLSFTITPRQSTQGETIRLVFWIGRVDNISTLGFADETAPNSNIFNANPDLMVYEARPVVLEINIGNTPFEVVWSDERLDSNENELDQNSTVSLLDPNVSYNRHYSVAVHNVSAGFETLGTQIARISNSTPEGSNPTVGQINAIVPYFQFAAYRSDEGFPSRTYTGTNRNAAGAIPQATALTQANWGAGMDRQNQLS